MATSGDQIKVTMKGIDDGEIAECYDAVLVAVGRRPNTDNLGLENTAASLNEKGFVEVDESRRTADESIYAIGDAAGEPLLAHKATREGELAVEAMCGEQPLPGDDLLVPAVVFTDPEVAWVGLTESAAEQSERSVKVATCSWKKSGRAHTLDRPDGVTKLVLDEKTERILGVGISGHGAGELIAEGALAIGRGATAFDFAATIHPHPTLSESLMEAGWNGVG